MSDPAAVPRLRVVVIGGGIGGLASAYRVLETATAKGTSPKITVLESSSRFGGVVESSERDGFVLEHGPDSILTTKPAGVRLLTDLGLEDVIQGTNADLQGGLIASGDRLLPIPDGLYLLAPTKMMPFALSPLMSWPGKFRMALELLLPRRDPKLPEESLAQFVRRRMGAEALDRIAQPLVSGIYSADPEKLSLKHCMPQFAQMEREHGSIIRGMRKNMKAAGARSGVTSGARYGMFVSLKGGLACLVDRLVDRLSACDLRTNCAATALERNGETYRIALADGSRIEADAVVLALPAHAAAKLCAGLDAKLGDDLASVRYSGIATVNLAFRRQDLGAIPNAAGFVVPSVEGRNIPACTFSSIKYLGRAPDDAVLLRAFVGGALHENDLDGDDPALVDVVLNDLRQWFPNLKDPLWSEIRRWPAAMAQPHVGHGERLARIRETEARVPGLALVGNGYEGVGIADIVAQAERAAEKLMTQRKSNDAAAAPLEKPAENVDRPKRPPVFDFNRSPFIVIWESTRACDLVCAHCRAEAQPTAHPKELSDDEARRLMDDVRRDFGPVLFVVTGGDPLKRHGLYDLVRHGADLGLRMAISPSATPLLTNEAVRRLKDAGIQRLAVSLDGSTAGVHDEFRGVGGTFERTMEALDCARAIGLSTQINSSIGKHNWHQLDEISEIVRSYGVALWSVFILVPTGRAGTEMLMTPADHEKVYLKLAKLALDPDTPFDIKTTAGQAYYRVRAQMAERRGLEVSGTVTTGRGGMRAPGGVNDGNGFVFIDHVGNIQPSGFLPLTCGNVRENELADVYREHPTFTKLRQADAFDGKCGVCQFNLLCGGSRSRTYALTGDPFGSDPTCLFEPRSGASR